MAGWAGVLAISASRCTEFSASGLGRRFGPACRSAIDFVYATGGPEPAGGQGCRGAARCLESKAQFPGL